MNEVGSAMSRGRARKTDRALLAHISDMVIRLGFNSRRSPSHIGNYLPLAAVADAPVRAIPPWIDQQSEGLFPASSPSKAIELTAPDGSVVRLEDLAGDTTLLLVVDQPMTLLPDLSQRIVRRLETLGYGVRLICIESQPQSKLTFSFHDQFRTIETLAGGFNPPFLVSLDRRGLVFDIVTDFEAIMHWLWNDPRPHSLRANVAMSMDELVG